MSTDNIIPDETVSNNGGILTPAPEALHNASISQKDVKKEYQGRLVQQDEVRARYLDHIKREKESLKKDKVAIKFKIRTLKDLHDACLESLHYAKQDLDHLMNHADITGKATAARKIVEGIEKEIFDAKRDISELEKLL
jgi:hypothetical protein